MENTAAGKSHPLVLAAAVSAIIVSLLGAVAISEFSPGAHPEKREVSAPKKQLAAELTIPASDSVCASCGRVEAVRAVEARGNEIEKNVQKRLSYRVTVRMDDGSIRTVSQPAAPTAAVGDRVRIANGTLVAGS